MNNEQKQSETMAHPVDTLVMLPCPFCGGEDLRDSFSDVDQWTWCKNQKCPIYDVEIRVNDWNLRAS